MLCLIVEFPAAGGELLPFTQQNPGASVELIAEPSPPGARDTVTALVLVRGAPWQAIDEFVATKLGAGGPVTTLRRVPVESLWFGRATFHPSAFRSDNAKALLSVLPLVGPPWVHMEHGVVHLRARIKDPTHAEEVLHLTQQTLVAGGLEAQAIVQEVSPKDYGVWETLVQRGIGMSL